MILQVSKISVAAFLLFILVFQQFNVGSPAVAATFPGATSAYKDTIRPDTSKSILRTDTIRTDTASSDSTLMIKADTLAGDTNVANEGLESEVKYHARDSMQVNIESEIVHLYGAATVDYQDLHLQSDYIVIDMKNKELYAEGWPDSNGVVSGTPEYSQADQKFRSNAIRYNFDSKKGKISYVITKEGEGYIHGEVVKKDPENNFFIRKGEYTTCDLDTPHFAIVSNKLKVIKNNKIVTGPAHLTIEGVPTPLLIPFGFFPNKKGRSSGLIFPGYGETAERGFYFQKLGYYFGFNDYVNLAITSDIYTKGSYAVDATTEYSNRYHYNGRMKLSYAYTVTSEKELSDYNLTKDFHVDWTHNQDPKLNPNSTFNARVNAGSSQFYRNTISSLSNVQQNTLESGVNYTHQFPDKPMNLGVSLRHWQNTSTHEIRIYAPDVTFNVTRINPFQRKVLIGRPKWYEKIGTSYSFKGTNFIDTKDSLLFRKNSLNNLQNGFQHSIPLSTSFNIFSYYNISPNVSYTERWYLKTTQYKWDSDSNKVDTFEVKKFQAARDYQASLGLSTRIYGMYQFKSGPIVAIRHVMTPSASISWRPDYSKPGYGYYKTVQIDTTKKTSRYSIFQNSVYGGPSAGQYANLGFSLDNNIEMKVRVNSDTGETTKKVKLLESLRISGGYNFIADSMKLSVFSFAGRTTLLDRLTLSFDGDLDQYEFDKDNNDIDRFMISNGGKLFRLPALHGSLTYSLNKSAPKESAKYSKQDLEYINSHPEEYVDFNVPFNFNVSYSYSYTKRGNEASTTIQSANFSGDVNLTPKWKIGFNSWYDFQQGKFTSLSTNIYRDLHCWEMHMYWVPFGPLEGWNFQINVKASILQDLKLLKKKDPYDR